MRSFQSFETPRLSAAHQRRFRRILGIQTGGHDSAAAIVKEGKVVEIIEYERAFREKRCRIFPHSIRFDRSLQWLFETYQIDRNFDAVAIQV